MHLLLTRTRFSAAATIGELHCGPERLGYVLEDVVRPAGQPWVAGRTAIPAGTYQVLVTFSNRFQRPLPLLVDQPGRRTLFGGRPLGECGIRIHVGNVPADSTGCLLVGTSPGPDGASIINSRVAFTQIFARIQQAIANHDPVTISIA